MPKNEDRGGRRNVWLYYRCRGRLGYGPVFAIALMAWVFWSSQAAAQQPMQLRLLGSDFSFWPTPAHTAPSTADPNARFFIFNLPTGFPTNFINTPPSTESWGGQPFIPGTDFPSDSLARSTWPALTNYLFVGAICGNGTDTNDTVVLYSTFSLDYELWAMPVGSTPDDAVQMAINYWKTNSAVPGANFLTADVSVTFKAKGAYEGAAATLPAAVGYAATSVPGHDAHNQDVIGDFILAADWGQDLMTNREFIILHLNMVTYASGGNLCLSLPKYCQQLFGAPDALTFQNNVISSLLAQISSGDAYIQGALPEQIFLYDFSMEHTVWPFKTISSYFSSFPAVDFGVINQYDGGSEFGLPTGSDDPRPGGNACGPTSLMMAMNVAGADTFILGDVYDNTMLYPPQDRITNSFYWTRAKAWLEGKISFEGTTFPTPRIASLPVDYLEQTGLKIYAWDEIDGLLHKKQPVLLRTDLGTDVGVGGGHVILLLGKGYSDRIAELGYAGDYYIVADPAGHYTADSRKNRHYMAVDQLKDEMEGINYGGWFAMYPAELIRTRIIVIDKNRNSIPTVRALTIGAPFSPLLQLQAQSPVAIMVTDPAGKQTGVQPDGSVLSGIPLSAYESPVGDGEDGTDFDPNGPKTVRIDTPMAGTYTIDLTGTNSGSYALIGLQGDANGASLGSNGFTGTISPGQKVTYQFTAVPSGPPPLLSSLQGNALGLFWTTNYLGYTLQANGNLADPNGWSAVGGVTVNGPFNVATNSNPSGTRYYRLKGQ